jgi:hypothetical protein
MEKRDIEKDLSELHDGPMGEHYGGDTTTHKILRVGCYWPSIFKYSHICKEIPSMSKVSRKREEKCFPSTSSDHRMSISTMGVWM